MTKKTGICPCGSNKNYAQCCGKYIDDKKIAPSPEAVMRARYTAYTLVNLDYLRDTMHENIRATYNEESNKEWAANSQWQSLAIIKAEPVDVSADTGYVDFVAKYITNEQLVIHHEISEFKKVDGVWYFYNGIVNPKLGRNDPCFCGSGKKYKKCCAV